MSPLSAVGHGLILAGLLGATFAVLAVLRAGEPYRCRHAANLLFPLGTLPILIGVALMGSPATAGRAAFVAVILVVTTPLAAHAIGQAALRRKPPGTVLETDQGQEEETGRSG